MKVETVTTWKCVRECDEHGEDPRSDLAAAKHMKATRHAVLITTRPRDTGASTGSVARP